MRHDGWPKVSVVISTYNRAHLLDRALESIYAQEGFDDFEIVVVDDASPDPMPYDSLFDKWVGKFDERKIDLWPYRIETNSGYQCFPKNRGIEKSSGDYIAYLDDDNTWRPHHLKTLVDAIESDFSTDMVYSRLHYIVDDDATREMLGKAFDGKVPEGDTIGTPWTPHKLAEANYIDTSSILHSKGAFWRMVRETGYGWDEALRRFGDWNFVWRWAIAGNNARLVDEVTVNYYWHKGSLQLTRPTVETPVCFNYAQYLAVRKETDRSLQSVS